MAAFRRKLAVLGLAFAFLVLTGCAPSAAPTEPAVSLPQLPDYHRVEGQTLTEYIGTLSGGASLLAGQPELAAAAAFVEGIVSCYQEVGAVRFAVYSVRDEPLASGAVAIADRAALSDPASLFRCVVPSLARPQTGSEDASFQPCQHTYALTRGSNEIYIAYVATQTSVCQAFCARLDGCTAH